MAKYIEQDAIYRKLEERYKYSSGEAHQAYSQAIDDLLSIPVIDMVEVVRCEKCKYHIYDSEYDRHRCNRLLSTFKIENDDFCSYGEREGKQSET